jgi:predicted extracellular nuclease
MYRKLTVLLFFCLLALNSWGQDIVIGSWNIEWLGKEGKRGGTHDNEIQKPDNLAQYIKDSEVDVLGLIEICVSDDLRSKILDKTFDILNSSGTTDWKYVIFPNRDKGDRDQLCGVAWNTKKVQKTDDYTIPITDKKIFDRRPVAVKFSPVEANQTDFALVVLHLKSNVGEETEKKREAEGKALAGKLSAIKKAFSKENDLILLGDYNTLKGTEPCVKALTKKKLIDLNQKDMHTFYGSHSPFDRILVPADQQEFSGAEMQIFKSQAFPDKQHEKKLSDHYLVKFMLHTVQDDD